MTALPLVDAALRGALFALLLLGAWRLWRDRRDAVAARVGVVFMLGLVVQVVSSTPLIESQAPCAWQAPAVGVSVGNSVLFWVFCSALFDDDFRPRPVHALAWATVFAIGVAFCVVAHEAPASLLAAGLRIAIRWAPALFAALAIVAAATQWRADLVERRRRLRAFIVFGGAAYTLAMVAVRLAAADGRLGDVASASDMAALLAIVAVVAAQMLHVTNSELLPEQASTADPQPLAQAGPQPSAGFDTQSRPQPYPQAERAAATQAADGTLAAALDRCMTEERAYRIEDLTVASLAAKLGTPEYRLRRVINQHLGHRNFNAYVNGFRLAEARAALADPAQSHLPVLTIALEAGFQSIGPFNRAFKADTGLTPTEFRQRHEPPAVPLLQETLADS